MPVVSAAGTALLELVFPTRCLGCDGRGDWFCDPCHAASVLSSLPTACVFCNRVTRRAGQLCATDRARTHLTGLVSYGDYHSEALAQAIRAIKYDGYFAGARPLALRAAERWSVLAATDATCIVPIPLAPARRRERGFNQAELLARCLAQLLAVPVDTGLVRIRETPSQVGLGRRERAHNLTDAFGWRGQPLFGTVILVDDVVTTGATLGAAAQTLRAHGALNVWGATLAADR